MARSQSCAGAIVLWATVAIAVLPAHALAGGLTVTDLGVVPGYSNSIAEAVNASGQAAIVSESTANPADFVSGVSTAGTVTPIGTLGGTETVATGLDNAGDVVGKATTSGSNPLTTAAFFYNAATQQMINLGTLGGATSVAYGINNSGVIVGQADTASGGTHAFEYANGTMKDLGSFVSGGRSFAMAINSAGYIAGSADTAVNSVGYPIHAMLIDPSGTYHDLGTLGTGLVSNGLAINSSNEVVGFSTLTATDFGTEHAFAYVNGKMMDLGTLGGQTSVANGVNDSGIVVGYSNIAGGGNDAFVYENGQMIDLNSLLAPNSGWTLIAATAINDAGQIVGYGVNPQGQLHGFEVDLASVPEPSSLVLLALGIGAMACSTGIRWIASARQARAN
jgi:probable HAF family extracellular repeat protein